MSRWLLLFADSIATLWCATATKCDVLYSHVTLLMKCCWQVWQEHTNRPHAIIKVMQQVSYLVKQLLPDLTTCMQRVILVFSKRIGLIADHQVATM